MCNTKYFELNRHAAWLELFLDLTFVVMIGDMASVLNHAHKGRFDPPQF